MSSTSHSTIVARPGDELLPEKERTGKCYLVKIYPPTHAGGLVELNDQRFLIGRGSECQLEINDSAVSRQHAYVEPRAGNYLLVDMGSTNGTYVNDERVEKHWLSGGDFIRIGSNIIKFLSSDHVEAQYHETIYSMMITDGLTAVHNRRYFVTTLERELARSFRHHRPLSLVMFDIDHFKKVNDTHGHLAGDAVLREVAARVQSTVRKDEVFARYGGEEFAVILPECSRDKATSFANRLRTLVYDEPVVLNDITVRVSISLGVSQTAGEREMTAAELIEEADKMLLGAKQAGRNRVQC